MYADVTCAHLRPSAATAPEPPRFLKRTIARVITGGEESLLLGRRQLGPGDTAAVGVKTQVRVFYGSDMELCHFLVNAKILRRSVRAYHKCPRELAAKRLGDEGRYLPAVEDRSHIVRRVAAGQVIRKLERPTVRTRSETVPPQPNMALRLLAQGMAHGISIIRQHDQLRPRKGADMGVDDEFFARRGARLQLARVETEAEIGWLVGNSVGIMREPLGVPFAPAAVDADIDPRQSYVAVISFAESG